MPLSDTWSFNSAFAGLFPDYGQIAHLLRTRAPVAAKGIATLALPLDLHVLGLSLAFILSQDQTLRCKNNRLSCSEQLIERTLLTGTIFSQFLYYINRFNLSKNIFFITAPFRSEIGCKSTATEWPDQIFLKLFWKKSVSRCKWVSHF